MTQLPDAAATAAGSKLADDVRAGLDAPGHKTLPFKYLYDALGSALFEAITQLPEYGLWRAERRLLRAHATDIAALAGAASVIELGSGSASKTLPLLEALLRRQRVAYCAIDLSPAALAMTRRELDGLAGLAVRGIEDEYLPGLEAAMQSRTGRTLVLFLGSSLGNFDALGSARFLQRVRRILRPGDALLLGADLEKPVARHLAAYDDALGVTAAFNLNLLARLNRELGADFELSQFRHCARFNAEMRSVEMHLESLRDQDVHFAQDDLTVSFRAGETIHTESSHKYSLDELACLASSAGFESSAQWVDEDERFATTLLAAV